MRLYVGIYNIKVEPKPRKRIIKINLKLPSNVTLHVRTCTYNVAVFKKSHQAAKPDELYVPCNLMTIGIRSFKDDAASITP